MSIEFRLSELLGRKRMSQKELSEKTKIRPATVNAMYHNKVKRIEIDQLERICKALECTPCDLLVLEEE